MMRCVLPVVIALGLAACSGDAGNDQSNLDSLDAELTRGQTSNAQDPLIASALADQIMVDPQLAAKSNADAVRPPAQPYAAPIPSPDVVPAGDGQDAGLKSAPAPRDCPECRRREALTLAALAAGPGGSVAGNCAAGVGYGAAWANRLPADLPLHASARVIEAAGNDAGGCALRIVSFVTPLSMQRLLDWYYTRATAAGYSADHRAAGGEHVLSGTRRDGAAYLLTLRDRDGGGTAIDLMANRGG